MQQQRRRRRWRSGTLGWEGVFHPSDARRSLGANVILRVNPRLAPPLATAGDDSAAKEASTGRVGANGVVGRNDDNGGGDGDDNDDSGHGSGGGPHLASGREVRAAALRGPSGLRVKAYKNLLAPPTGVANNGSSNNGGGNGPSVRALGGLVGLRPVEGALRELRRRFGSVALFFCDALAGDAVAVVWRPAAFLPAHPFRAVAATNSSAQQPGSTVAARLPSTSGGPETAAAGRRRRRWRWRRRRRRRRRRQPRSLRGECGRARVRLPADGRRRARKP